jgi:hypothetical protein
MAAAPAHAVASALQTCGALLPVILLRYRQVSINAKEKT